MSSRASSISTRLFDWAIPSLSRQDAEVLRRAKRIALLDVTFFFWAIVFAGVYLAAGSTICSLMTLAYTLWCTASLLALRQGKSPTFSANVLCTGGCATLVADAVFSGGSQSPPLLWLGCAPVVAVVTSGAAWGAVWLVAALAMIAALMGVESLGLAVPNDLAPDEFRMLYYAVVFGSVICQFGMVWVGVGIEQRARNALRESNRQLTQARQVLDSLQHGFGFSLEEWTKLKREKQALEYALSCRNAAEDRAIDEELDKMEAALRKMSRPPGRK